jgi:PAS domain S-box-containing protein
VDSTQEQPGDGLFYRALFEQSPVPMWVFDRATLNFVDVNAAACRHYGYTRDEILALAVTDMRPAEDVERFAAVVREAKAGPVSIGRWRHKVKSGALIIVDVNWTPLELKGRACMLAVLRDVTEQVRAEAALREVEARFKSVVQHAPLAFTIKDKEGRYQFCNDVAQKILGVADDSYIGKTVRDIFGAAGAATEAEERKVVETGQPSISEVDLAGRPIEHALVVKFPIRDAGGAIVALGGFAVDLTGQHRAEQALLTSERRMSRIVDLVQEAIWIHDKGTIMFANPAAARLFGTGDPAELIGKSIFPFLHPADRAWAQERTKSLIADHLPLVPVEMRINGFDGKERVAELQAVPLPQRDEMGNEKVLAIASGRDVTAQRQAERQLLQAVKMEAVGQLTGGIAHDFNNLLTIIIGSLDLDRAQVPAELRNTLDQALRAAERGAALTHRLLAFSRQQTLQPGKIDCNKLVGGMSDLLRRTLGEQIEIGLQLAPDLKPALADQVQVETALLNLAINARDAMPNGGKLLLETGNATLDEDYVLQNPDATCGDFVMIAVSDTGKGMSPEVLAHAFEPFFTTKEVGKGTGLGLSMIYGFAKQSGGHVRIYSEVGLGTTVRLYLPRFRAADAALDEPAAAPAVKPGQGGGETILAVEDDPRVRKLVLQQLDSLGYKVIEAGTGAEALKIIDSDLPIDLLFTDVVMPGGMNGKDLADAARRKRPGLKVLFTSGYAEGSMPHRGALDPGIRMLSKPYRKAALAEKIREALEG